MSRVLVLNRLLCLTILTTMVLFASSYAAAQTAVIEPCQSSPTPNVLVPAKTSEKASQTLIDSGIADDPDLLKLLSPYSDKVKALSIVVGTLDGTLTKSMIGSGTLGHFVTDAILAQARRKSTKNIVLAVTNAGGLRKNEIAPGQLRASDIFELMPFENELITLDLTGEQLNKILQIGTRDAQAGAQIQYRWNEQNRTEVISARLLDAKRTAVDIDPKAMYTIVTTDYLYKLHSGAYAILQDGKNLTLLGITVRDAVTNYVKSETAAGRHIKSQTDNRYVQIGPGPVKQETPPR
jgi:2',3'-cyclic-nucleotide 2'-phosphodiesterase (5'-nucleotidase family)